MSGETLNIPLGTSHTATLTVPHQIQNKSEVRNKVTEVANQIFKDMSLQNATYILATINNPNTNGRNFYDLKATNPGDTSLTPQQNISSEIEGKIEELRNLIWIPAPSKFNPAKVSGQKMTDISDSALQKKKATLKRTNTRPSSSSSSSSTSGSEIDRIRAGLKPVRARNSSYTPSSSSSTSGSEMDRIRAGLKPVRARNSSYTPSSPSSTSSSEMDKARTNLRPHQTRQNSPTAPPAPSLPSTKRGSGAKHQSPPSKNSGSDARPANKQALDVRAPIRKQVKIAYTDRASGSSSSSSSAAQVPAKADPLAVLRRQLRDKRLQSSSMNSTSSSSERTLHTPVPAGSKSSLDLHNEQQKMQQQRTSEGRRFLRRVRDGQPLSVIFSTKNADSLEPALSRAMDGLELNSQAATISPFIEKQFSLPLENSSLSRSTSSITVSSSDDEDEPASLEITPFSRASSELSDTSDSDDEFEALSNSAAGRMLNTLRQKDQELVYLQQASSSTSDKSDIESQKTSILQNIKTLEPLIIQISDNLNENDDDFEIMRSHCDRFMAYENFALKLENDPIITPQMIEKIHTDLNQFTHDIIQLVTESRRVDSYPEKEGSDEALI